MESRKLKAQVKQVETGGGGVLILFRIKINCPKRADYIGKLCSMQEEKKSLLQAKFLYLNSRRAKVQQLQARLPRGGYEEPGVEHKSNNTKKAPGE